MTTRPGGGRARILVAEDEALIAIVLQDMLEALGCEVVGPASTLDEARRLAAEGGFDAAVLDVRLGSELVYPAAQVVSEQRLPLILATGSDRDELAPAFRNAIVLNKPYSSELLRDALGRALPHGLPGA